MSGRVTEPGSQGDDHLPTLRERSPWVYWVAIISVIGLVLGATGGALLLFLA
jgi:hypothetical protein